MSNLERIALLPAGLRDVLPPDAAYEAEVVERLLADFARHGYERIKPPFVEFEESLLSGPGAAMASETFRLMDPVSQRMMGVRADITPQVARIAMTRLKHAPRPLRLSYAGEVLRVKGTQLRPERQFRQVGVELIGAASAAADAEVIVMAAEALQAAGVGELSVDLTMPPLVPALCEGLELRGDKAAEVRAALDRKDAATVAALGGRAARTLTTLLHAAGPADHALAALDGLELPANAAEERRRLEQVIAIIRGAAPAITLTVDPVENRGFEYHTGIAFTMFAPGVRGELGSGGRYLAGADEAGLPPEPATGCTLYVDTILRVLPEPAAAARLFLPSGTPPEAGRRLRAEGWTTVAGLAPVADARAEARRLGCSHALIDGEVVRIEARGGAG